MRERPNRASRSVSHRRVPAGEAREIRPHVRERGARRQHQLEEPVRGERLRRVRRIVDRWVGRDEAQRLLEPLPGVESHRRDACLIRQVVQLQPAQCGVIVCSIHSMPFRGQLERGEERHHQVQHPQRAVLIVEGGRRDGGRRGRGVQGVDERVVGQEVEQRPGSGRERAASAAPAPARPAPPLRLA